MDRNFLSHKSTWVAISSDSVSTSGPSIFSSPWPVITPWSLEAQQVLVSCISRRSKANQDKLRALSNMHVVAQMKFWIQQGCGIFTLLDARSSFPATNFFFVRLCILVSWNTQIHILLLTIHMYTVYILVCQSSRKLDQFGLGCLNGLGPAMLNTYRTPDIYVTYYLRIYTPTPSLSFPALYLCRTTRYDREYFKADFPYSRKPILTPLHHHIHSYSSGRC